MRVTDKLKSLNARHERFALEYVRTNNASLAYSVAYPNAKPTTCMIDGPRLSRDPLVADLIKKHRDAIMETSKVDANAVIEEFKKIAFADVTDVVSVEDGTVKFNDEIPKSTRGAISEIATGKNGEIKVKMHDKVNALSKLGAHLGLFVEKVDVNVKVEHDFTEEAKAALARIRERKAIEAEVVVESTTS